MLETFKRGEGGLGGKRNTRGETQNVSWLRVSSKRKGKEFMKCGPGKKKTSVGGRKELGTSVTNGR